MPVQLRLIETRTSQGHSNVTIDAATPAQAAVIIARAHRRSVATGSAVIRLPDGQSVMIDQNPPEAVIGIVLLDEDGREVGPLEVPKPRRGRAKRE